MASTIEELEHVVLSEEDLNALDFNNSLNSLMSASSTTTIIEQEEETVMLASGPIVSMPLCQFSADKEWPFENVNVRGHKLKRAQLLLGATSATALADPAVKALTLDQLLDEVCNGTNATTLPPHVLEMFSTKTLYTAWRCIDGMVIATQRHNYILEGTSLTQQCFWSAKTKRHLVDSYGKTAQQLNGVFTSPSGLVGEFYNDKSVRRQLENDLISDDDIAATKIANHTEWKRDSNKGTSIKYALKAFKTLGVRVVPKRNSDGVVQVNEKPLLTDEITDAMKEPDEKKQKKAVKRPQPPAESSSSDSDDDEEVVEKKKKKAPVKKSPPKKKYQTEKLAQKAPVETLTKRTTFNSLAVAVDEAEKIEIDEQERSEIAAVLPSLAKRTEQFHGRTIDHSYDPRTDDGNGVPPEVAREWILACMAEEESKKRKEREESFAIASEAESALRRDFDEHFELPLQPPPEMMVEDQMIKMGLDRLRESSAVVIPCDDDQAFVFPRPMLSPELCKKVLRAPEQTRLAFLRKNQPGRFVADTQIARTSFCIQDGIVRHEIKDRVPSDKQYCNDLLEVIDKIMIDIVAMDGGLPKRVSKPHLSITKDAFMILGYQLAYGHDDLEQHYKRLLE